MFGGYSGGSQGRLWRGKGESEGRGDLIEELRRAAEGEVRDGVRRRGGLGRRP